MSTDSLYIRKKRIGKGNVHRQKLPKLNAISIFLLHVYISKPQMDLQL